MIFTETKEQEFMRKLARRFAEEVVEPVTDDLDRTGEFPKDIVKQMAGYGMMGLTFPKEYGGAGADYICYSILIEELSRVHAAVGTIVAAHTSLCAWPIYAFGTEEQKQKYLIPLAKGEQLGAFGLTEPNAGSDAGGQQTKAVDMGDHWLLNGSKVFITNGAYADTFVVFALTDKSKGTKGITAFIVEKGFPGFSIGKSEEKLGIHASSTTELIFEDCIVPKENLLGQVGKGFGVAMATLEGGRVGVAAQALGIAQGALDQTIIYMKARKQFGKSLSKFQALQFEMADIKTRIEASRLLVYSAAYKKDCHKPHALDSAMAKYYAAETAMHTATKCLQFHGGYGFIKDYAIERFFRDAKITEIYEGTSEVQKMIISSHIFK